MARKKTDLPQAPDNAFRAPGWMSITEIKGPDGRTLNLHNIIFVEGGSLIWFEEPATLAVWHVFPIGQEPKDWDSRDPIRRYEGTWEPADASAPVATPGHRPSS